MNYFQKKDELLASRFYLTMERIKAAKIEESSAKEIEKLEKELKYIDSVIEAAIADCVYEGVRRNLMSNYIGDILMKQIAAESAANIMIRLKDEGIFADA